MNESVLNKRSFGIIRIGLEHNILHQFDFVIRPFQSTNLINHKNGSVDIMRSVKQISELASCIVVLRIKRDMCCQYYVVKFIKQV
jgi:hypothetical protein